MLLRLRELQLDGVEWMGPPVWLPLFREEVLKEANRCDQKAKDSANENKGSYSTSERCTAHSQNPGKFLACDHDICPSLPYLRADIPLSSTDGDDGEREGDHVGTLKRVT